MKKTTTRTVLIEKSNDMVSIIAEKTPEEISLDKISNDTKYQVRETLDEETITEYREIYKENPSHMLPLTLVRDGEKFVCIAGFHRVEAARRAKRKTIAAIVIEGSEEVQTENDRLRRAVDSDALGWNDLEIEMDRRALQSCEILNDQMFEFETGVRDKLLYQIGRAPNPREWWEKDLPFMLSTELKGIHRQLSGLLRDRLLTDAKWLSDQAEKRFSTQWKNPEPVGPLLSNPGDGETIRPEAAQLRDLNQIRTYTRAGMAVATVGGFMLFGPFGALVPAFATLVTEQGHRTLQAGQVETLSKRIPDLIHEMLDKAVGEGKGNIKKYYGRAVAEIRSQKQLWMNAKLAAIQSSLQAGSDEETIATWTRQWEEVAGLQERLSK